MPSNRPNRTASHACAPLSGGGHIRTPGGYFFTFADVRNQEVAKLLLRARLVAVRDFDAISWPVVDERLVEHVPDVLELAFGELLAFSKYGER